MPITLPIGDVVKCSQCGGQTRSLSREYDCPGRPANRNRYARPQRGASC